MFGDGTGDCEKTLAAIETATNPAQKNRNMRDVDLSRIWPLLNSGSGLVISRLSVERSRSRSAKIRKPNLKILKKQEIQAAGSFLGDFVYPSWDLWSFEVVSDFGIRISDFSS